MKQFFLGVFLMGASSLTFAQVDYSKIKPANPYSRYEYKSAEEWREIKKQELAAQQAFTQTSNNNPSNNGVDYFNKNSINPLTAAKSQQSSSKRTSNSKGQGKYKHLAENQHRIGQCWDQAASTYKVDPWLLMAIAKTESSFNPNAVNKANKNGSTDYGLMQINSFWLKTLKQHNITKDDLLEPCVSIFVGAWILSENIKQFGYNIDGIGAYNAPRNVKIRRNYASKVYANYRTLVADLYHKKGSK